MVVINQMVLSSCCKYINDNINALNCEIKSEHELQDMFSYIGEENIKAWNKAHGDNLTRGKINFGTYEALSSYQVIKYLYVIINCEKGKDILIDDFLYDVINGIREKIIENLPEYINAKCDI